jgi:hypothetical protein
MEKLLSKKRRAHPLQPHNETHKRQKTDEDENKGPNNSDTPESLHFIIVIRDGVTEKIYETWKLQFMKRFPFTKMKFDSKYQGDDNCYIVVSKDCSGSTFLEWLGKQTLGDNVTIISADWMVKSLKQNKMVPMEKYYLDPFVKAEKEKEKEQEEKKKQKEEEKFAQVITDDGREDVNIQETLPLGLEETELEILQKESDNETSTVLDDAEFDKSVISDMNDPPNKRIIDIFEQLQQIYEISGEEYRGLAYKKAAATIKQLPFKIINIEQLHDVPNIGKSIGEKIQEIVETGRLEKLKHLQDNPILQSMIELSRIWGVGEKTALKLVKKGYRSIDDLRKQIGKPKFPLNAQQMVGLRHYEDFLLKVPRDEVEELHNIVHQHCLQLFSSSCHSEVCGSYRRGKPFSSDIDILITLPTPPGGSDEEYPANSLFLLVQSLSAVGFLTDHLTHASFGGKLGQLFAIYD